MAFLAEQAFQLLVQSMEQDRLAHAYLITGSAGSGTEELAARLIEKVNGKPCPNLETAASEWVHMVRPESKSRRIRVENMRGLEKRMYVAAPREVTKIGVVMDADRMMPEAANAFLKTLEEPPNQSLLLLLSSNPEQLLDTILSRCIQVPLHSTEVHQPSEAEEALLRALSQHFQSGAGGLSGAWTLQRTFVSILKGEKDAIGKAHAAELKSESSTYGRTTEGDWLKRREDYYKALTEADYIQRRNVLIQVLVNWYGDMLRQKDGAGHLDLASWAEETARAGQGMSESQLFHSLEALEKLRADLNTSIQEGLALEAGFIRAFA